MHDTIGRKVTDKITAFHGTAIARCEYMTGCNQILVQPECSEGSWKKPESEWFDEQRLDVDMRGEKVALDKGDAPGFDKSAPKR